MYLFLEEVNTLNFMVHVTFHFIIVHHEVLPRLGLAFQTLQIFHIVSYYFYHMIYMVFVAINKPLLFSLELVVLFKILLKIIIIRVFEIFFLCTSLIIVIIILVIFLVSLVLLIVVMLLVAGRILNSLSFLFIFLPITSMVVSHASLIS